MKVFIEWLLRPATRIALGLVSLVLSLVLVGEVFTGYPLDRGEVARHYRSQVARMLGNQVALVLRGGPGDNIAMQGVLNEAKRYEPALLSIRVVGADGRMLAEVGPHAAGWKLAPLQPSTVDNIRVDLTRNERAWGEVQLVYVPAKPDTFAGWLRDPMVHWLVFIVLVGLMVFSLYLRRVLRYLDPNAAVPERVRAAFDMLTEGVLVLDTAGRIMLANRAFCSLRGEDARALTGTSAAGLGWLMATLPAGGKGEPPWMEAVRLKQPVLGVALTLDAPGYARRDLVLNCAPIVERATRVRGCLASFSDVTDLHERTERLRAALEDLHASQREITLKNEELTLVATRDALTGIFNRRSLMQQADQHFARARAAGTAISCIMCDIDHFKQVNDKFGHAGGDRVVLAAARALSHGLRMGDFVGRYGGEEFCIILPGAGLATACEVAERLRAEIAAHLGGSLRGHTGVRITMSFGAAEIGPGADDLAGLIDLADQALYFSKRNGRNRVTPWSEAATVQVGGAGSTGAWRADGSK